MSPIRMTLNFYPRPPRGGRPGCGGELAVNVNISIHALREEGDDCGTQGLRWIAISIHALREEGDHSKRGKKFFHDYFYPRPPRGGRPGDRAAAPGRRRNFYPRPPRGGRRGLGLVEEQLRGISIHALREEGDPRSWSAGMPSAYFYPRPPRGGRHHQHRTCLLLRRFLSTPSARRATRRPFPR